MCLHEDYSLLTATPFTATVIYIRLVFQCTTPISSMQRLAMRYTALICPFLNHGTFCVHQVVLVKKSLICIGLIIVRHRVKDKLAHIIQFVKREIKENSHFYMGILIFYNMPSEIFTDMSV